MALLVLCDGAFRNTPWCDLKLRGIGDEASRRRETVKVFTDIDLFAAAAAKLDETSSAIVIYDSISNLQKAAAALSHLRVHPIVASNVNKMRLACRYSSVGTDVEDTICTAVDYLYGCGKKRIAMVGVNRNSCGDLSRAEMFERYTVGETCKVLEARGDMQDCFAEFLKERDNFDAVICPNDHLAICLIEFLKEHGAYSKELFVISYGNTIMARLYSDGLTSFTTGHYASGKAAAETHFNRLKFGWSTSDILIKNELVIRGSTGNIPYKPSAEKPTPNDIIPPSSPTLFRIPTNPIGRIERMLMTSDIVNLKLIYCMLCGFSYERMGEFCFLSIEAAKYRVRKIRTALLGKSKSDAADLIRAYIDKYSLLHLIEEYESSVIENKKPYQ